MCGKDTECIENGAKFLWFLKSEHTYNYGYLDKCDSGCVSDFIKGLWHVIAYAPKHSSIFQSTKENVL